MHDPSAEGPEFFKCDFCGTSWSEDRPMVEGHRGSLICGACLTIAWVELFHHTLSDTPRSDEACVLCLESARPEPHWRSPATDALACRRCVKQSAGVLHKDRDTDWSKPQEPASARPERAPGGK